MKILFDMRIIFIGPPGSGKGTQAAFLTKHFQIPHISTGEMFRKEINSGTIVGLKAKEYKDSGRLVPDTITIGIVQERLNQADCANGFLLDGFPRNVAQAEALDKILQGLQIKLDGVINIEVDEKKLLARITSRRVCNLCGETYNQIFHPPVKEAVCDKCGGELCQRADDTLKTVRNRLHIHNQQTESLINYYRSQGLLIGIQGDQEINKIQQDILNALDKINQNGVVV